MKMDPRRGHDSVVRGSLGHGEGNRDCRVSSVHTFPNKPSSVDESMLLLEFGASTMLI